MRSSPRIESNNGNRMQIKYIDKQPHVNVTVDWTVQARTDLLHFAFFSTAMPNSTAFSSSTVVLSNPTNVECLDQPADCKIVVMSTSLWTADVVAALVL